MQSRKKNILVISTFVIVLILLLGITVMTITGPIIGNVFSNINSTLNGTAHPNMPSWTLAPTGAAPIQNQLAQIDNLLSQSLSASIAYNTPDVMKMDETTTIELLLNPSKSGDELSQEITESGTVVAGTVEITPFMKAELKANNGDAFVIQSIHDNAEQIIGGTETTRWAWLVTAQKGGTQILTLVIYRMIKYEGEEYWREVETYKADIDVKVTFAQRIRSLDWKWIIGIVLTAVLLPLFWRWYDKRNKKRRK